MARNPLIGMAQRWLREQVATDHRADDRIARIEHEARHEAQQQLGQALLPGLHRHNQERDAARAARAAAAEQARRAGMAVVRGAGLRVEGDLPVTLADVLVDVTEEDGVLTVSVEPTDRGGVFTHLGLAVVGYRGPGRYDLAAVDVDDRDPLADVLVLDREDEPFWPDLESGPCLVDVTPDGLVVDIAWADAASRRVRLTGHLPVVPPPAGQ